MRTIKFRAWTELEDEFGKKHMAMLDNDCLGIWTWEDLFDPLDTNHYLMQFTGLLDKNGKEIYEGDIVQAKYPYGTTGVIAWIDKRGGFMIKMIDGLNGGAAYDKEGYKLNSFKCEVIGNIYENPELLDNKNK